MEKILAFFIGLVLLGDLAVVGVHALDKSTNLVNDRRPTAAGPQDVKVVPADGQAFVTGTADTVEAEKAQVKPIKTPFTLTPVERGVGRATIEKALVAGKRVTINWDGGTPLPVSGGGELTIGAAKVTVTAKGPQVHVDGEARSFVAGTYSLGATVGVGTSGIGTPREGVTFTADEQTVLVSRGEIVVDLDPQKIDLLGPGKLTMTGKLKVQRSAKTENATSVTFGGGPYRVTVEPGNAGLTLDAILQGDVSTG